MDRLPLATMCAAMLILVGAALAADGDGEVPIADWSLFESIDIDRNGWISQQEFQLHGMEHPEAQPVFVDIDADRNGTVSWQEWAVHGTEESQSEVGDEGANLVNGDSADGGMEQETKEYGTIEAPLMTGDTSEHGPTEGKTGGMTTGETIGESGSGQ